MDDSKRGSAFFGEDEGCDVVVCAEPRLVAVSKHRLIPERDTHVAS